MSDSSHFPLSNHLQGEKSPYLLQHAQNPVDWYPWGEAAFSRARAENKPIFLSVGYSTCHWCHVMAHESFENDATSQLLNEHFINIKVDREERPDVDRLYMSYVQATTGQGGWPMSVWLTPDLKPFVGGTYFPPQDAYGRAGFSSLLQRIIEAWKTNQDKVLAQGEAMIQALRQNSAESASAAPTDNSHAGTTPLERGYQIFTRIFDATEGGWGSAPKFPRPVVFSFLLREYIRRGAHTVEGRHAAEMALFTLRKMASGGMHDHLGGGFHRYSVDEFWHVPHFEKMLYDQGQLVCSYLEAFQLTGETPYAEVARDILDYVLRDMTDSGGGFYSAEDADSLLAHDKPDHAEGAFYVWTKAEIDSALNADEARLFNFIYGMNPEGNAPAGADPHGEFNGKNILIQRHSLDAAAHEFSLDPGEAKQRLAVARKTLFEIRAKRPRPHLDDKIITAWNGLMISAFARACLVLQEQKHLTTAQRSASFIREHLTDSKTGELLRSYRQGPGAAPGFADDYAFLIQGLLDLYEADLDSTWLQWALALQEKMNALFWDAAHGGYFSTSGKDTSVLLRLKEEYDGAEPSANSVAALNLLRLASMTGNSTWHELANQLLRSQATALLDSPIALPQLLTALQWSLAKPLQIVFATTGAQDSTLAPLQREVYQKLLPQKIVMHARDTQTQRDAAPLEGKATAYVCINFACDLPTNDPAILSRQLSTSA